MFIGHFGVGLASKPAAKQTSLGTLLLASQFIDLLWPTLLLVGLESVEIAPGSTKLTPLEFIHYPISHSLLAVVGWSILFAAVYFALRRTARPALICGALVASHWFLDALTHKPDLLLYPGGTTKIGLGLWNHPAIAIILEEGNELIGSTLTSGDEDIILVTHEGISLRFSEQDTRPLGRSSQGVMGIRPVEGDYVVGLAKVTDDCTLLVASENGLGKRTAFEEYRKQSRDCRGAQDQS